MDNNRNRIEGSIIRTEEIIEKGKPKMKKRLTVTTMHKDIDKPNVNIERKRIAGEASKAATSALANFRRERSIEKHNDLGM